MISVYIKVGRFGANRGSAKYFDSRKVMFMPKKIWDMDVGWAVDSSPGTKTIGDYSGLYKSKNSLAEPVRNLHRGSDAQRHLNVTLRRRLNEGADFVGFLVSRNVDHVTLHIGMHPIYGLSAYADRVTSHADGRIEVIASNAKAPVLLTRSEFFGQLLAEEVPEARIAEFCQLHWHA